MKISLGLILFTIVSTALVYGENKPITENDLMVHISENAFLYNSAKYFDNTMISTNPGTSITIINNDVLKVSEDQISNDKLTVFGNLPYNISTQILSRFDNSS